MTRIGGPDTLTKMETQLIVIEAQLIVIAQNGYMEARENVARNRYEVVNVETTKQIQPEIWKRLRGGKRQVSVLVKWHGKLYLCELKIDGRNYTRVEVDYHPYQDRFTLR